MRKTTKFYKWLGKNTLGKFEQKRKTDNITIVQHKMQGKMHQRGNNLFQFDNNYEPQ